MHHHSKIRQIYSKRAGIYESLMKKARYVQALQEILRSISLEPAERILDIGCGTGLATEIFIQRFPQADIMGLDFSEEMLNIYHKKFPHLKTVIGDFNEASILQTFQDHEPAILPQSSFDLVVSAGAVSEYGDLKKVIPFIYSILKEDGIFINIGVKKNMISPLTGKIWHYRSTGKKKFASACRNSGFSSLKDLYIPWHLFPVNVLKFAILVKK